MFMKKTDFLGFTGAFKRLHPRQAINFFKLLDCACIYIVQQIAIKIGQALLIKKFLFLSNLECYRHAGSLVVTEKVLHG